MKKRNHDVTGELAEQLGNELANEFDNYENVTMRQELDNKIERMIFAKKIMPKPKKALLVACVFLVVFLVGAMTVYQLNFKVSDNGIYGELTPLISNADFNRMVDVPSDYNISEVTELETLSRVTFVKGDDVIVFTESSTDLSIVIDTESTEVKKIVLANGYEGFYIDKHGFTIIWGYDNYYYKLYCSDKDVDLLEIASSLHSYVKGGIK